MHNPSHSASFGELSGISTRWFARLAAPRKHYRVLPTRTRPNLFGGD